MAMYFIRETFTTNTILLTYISFVSMFLFLLSRSILPVVVLNFSFCFALTTHAFYVVRYECISRGREHKLKTYALAHCTYNFFMFLIFILGAFSGLFYILLCFFPLPLPPQFSSIINPVYQNIIVVCYSRSIFIT